MLIDVLKSIILGIVEGITEFLPISSTGHLIIINQWISFGETFTKVFDVVIQLGAILAVIVFFWQKLWPFGKEGNSKAEIFSTWKKTIIGVVPAIVIGALLGSVVEEKLFTPWVVASALLVGGIILIFIEKRKTTHRFSSVAEIPFLTAFLIGLIQCLSMIPGTSRAAATIIGAMLLGVSRIAAVEFSFFLAIPTMIAASGYSLLKHGAAMSSSEIILLVVGFITAFLVALAVIKFFVGYIQKKDFKPFGYYRIILAIVILAFLLVGVKANKEMVDARHTAVASVQAIAQLPIEVLPKTMYPGDPVFITINHSSPVNRILWDKKPVSTFMYEGKTRALMPIDFHDKITNHEIVVQLENGESLVKNITITPRQKIEKPLGIPEKLGGNTQQAADNLVKKLADENWVLNSVKTATSTFWTKSFAYPLQNIFVTDDYGYNRATVGSTIVHRGTDFRALTGTEVKAMNRGAVKIARLFTVYGNTVVIDHGLGVQTLYMHMSELKVKEGDVVEKGTLLGLSGETGYAEAPHLHVSVKINAVSIDPMTFLKFFEN
jgi:undecaprenyl-diphosphatase